ncbi:hypothetical protein, partial [Paenibacillus alvei]|uniref:hypothetical protein n=1 Tax=Paenibacillus alvei TaxID=44250 RepID=UPI0019D53903
MKNSALQHTLAASPFLFAGSSLSEYRTHRFPLSFRFSPSAFRRPVLRVLWLLLTPAGSAQPLGCGYEVTSHFFLSRRPPQIRTSSFRPRSPKFTTAAFGSFGFRHVLVTHPTATASNWVRVP